MFGGIIVLVISSWLLAWHLSRPSRFERRFVKNFRQIRTLGARTVITDFFGQQIWRADKGISKKLFVEKCVEHMSKPSSPLDNRRRVRKQATLMWRKMDADRDGHLSLHELVTYLYDLRDQGKMYGSFMRLGNKFVEWWSSTKVATLRFVMLTHFQLLSSISTSLPDLFEHRWDGRQQQSDGSNRRSTNSTSSSDGFVDQVQDGLANVAGAVSNANAAILEFVACFIGPRHWHKLFIPSLTSMACLALAWLVPSTLKWAAKRGVVCTRHPELLDQLSQYCFRLQLLLIFIVYPAVSQTALRTFVCEQYRNSSGFNASFLVDDTTIPCEAGSTDSGVSVYLSMTIYSVFVVIVVALGFPAILLYFLWSWRRPFDRLYVVDDEGQEMPTQEALDNLQTLVLFRQSSWYFASVDLVFKLIVACLIGVIFQQSQVAGACVSWFCCAAIATLYAYKKPYLYAKANYISVASYGALAVSFTSALTETLMLRGEMTRSDAFKTIVHLLWFLPLVMALADFVNAWSMVVHLVGKMAHAFGCDGRLESCKRSHRFEGTVEAASAARERNNKRTEHMLRKLVTLSQIAHEANSVRQGETQRHRRTVAEAVRAVGDSLEVMISILASGHHADMTKEGRPDAVVVVLQDAVEDNDEELHWQHFIDAETAVRSLSSLVFPLTTLEEQRISRQKASTIMRDDKIRLSYNNRKALWESKEGIATQLRRLRKQRAERNDRLNFDGKDKVESIAAARAAAAAASPNMKEFEQWRRFMLALLAPGADFGWTDFDRLSTEEKQLRKLARSMGSGGLAESNFFENKDQAAAATTGVELAVVQDSSPTAMSTELQESSELKSDPAAEEKDGFDTHNANALVTKVASSIAPMTMRPLSFHKSPSKPAGSWLKRHNSGQKRSATTPLGITQNWQRAENETLRARVQALEAELKGVRLRAGSTNQ